MGTLFIDRKGLHIRLDGNALSFYNNGEREGIVPIKPLKRVVVVGNVTFETSVLHRLSDEGISVVFLSGKRARFCGMMHGRLHNNGFLRIKQYEKSITSPELIIEFSKDIVCRKLCAQMEVLREAMSRRSDLRLSLMNAIKILENIINDLNTTYPDPIPHGDGGLRNETKTVKTLDAVRGLEGGAAASYFSAYTKLFPESLACDLVEPYRPDVDRFVWEIFRDRVFTERDFSHEDERPGCYLKKDSRKRFYPLYEEWAQTKRQRIVEEVRSLARRIMDGADPLSE